jgi:tetratricopeptide (TPR) repeat protein
MNGLGLILTAKGDYAEAEPLYRLSLAAKEKALGPDHPDVANSLNNLAELLRAKGDYAGAEPLYRRALAIVEKALGPDHPHVAICLNNLALLLKSKRDYAGAEPLYQRALAIDERALGADHPLDRPPLAGPAKLLNLRSCTDSIPSALTNPAEQFPSQLDRSRIRRPGNPESHRALARLTGYQNIRRSLPARGRRSTL